MSVPPVAPSPPVPQAMYSQPAPIPRPAVPQLAYPPAQPPYPPPQAYPSYPVSKPEPTAPVLPPAPGASSAVAGPSTAPALPVNLSALFSNLVKSGVLSSSSTPLGAGATAEGSETKPTDIAPDFAKDYRRAVLSARIKLTSADIVKYVPSWSPSEQCANIAIRQRPPIVKLFYENLSNQCKQCGVRFAGDAAGKKKLEDHLDMHFNQNRKATQAVGRGYSRSWFVGIDVSYLRFMAMSQ